MEHPDFNNTLIVEGVHLTQAFIKSLINKYDHHVLCFNISIQNKETLINRFAFRSKNLSINPENNQYVSNYEQINEIQNYLLKCVNSYNSSKAKDGKEKNLI